MKKHITQLLSVATALRDGYTKELNKQADGVLHVSREFNKKSGLYIPHYYCFEKNNGIRTKRRINSDKRSLFSLAHKAYLEECLGVLERNVSAMELANEGIQLLDHGQILRVLRERFPGVPDDAFLTGRPEKAQKLESDFDIDPIGDFAGNGISMDLFRWGQSAFTVNSYPYDNEIYTSRGLRVRSKNELLIAERLYVYDIPFHYDQVWYLNGEDTAPDFTFMNHAKNLAFWEHCGLMDQEKYQKNYYFKRDIYERAGFKPWENLFYTFTMGNDLSVAEIDCMIKYRVLPWVLSGLEV